MRRSLLVVLMTLACRGTGVLDARPDASDVDAADSRLEDGQRGDDGVGDPDRPADPSASDPGWQTDQTFADPGGESDAGPVCGNEVVEPGEACDDGNRLDDDGCSADCATLRCANYPVGTLAKRCGPTPLLYDSGLSSFGLLPWTRRAGTYNPYVLDGNASAPDRLELLAAAEALGLRPYWLIYGGAFEGLLGWDYVRGAVPNGSEPITAALVDDCDVGTSAAGGGGACRATLGGCGAVVGAQTDVDAALDDWLQGGPYIAAEAATTPESEGGLWPDSVPAPSVDLIQLDLEGACFSDLNRVRLEASDLQAARALHQRLAEATAAGLMQGTFTGGPSPTTEFGTYGIPGRRLYVSSFRRDGALQLAGLGDTGSGWGDACALVVGASPRVPNQLNSATLGEGAAMMGFLVPWLLWTGAPLATHPAFSDLSAEDRALVEGQLSGSDREDVFAFSFAPETLRTDLQPPLDAAYGSGFFDTLSNWTSLPVATHDAELVGGTVLFPSLYAAAGTTYTQWGDPTRNAWNQNRFGLGAPVFGDSLPQQPSTRATFDHLRSLTMEGFALANRVMLEQAWAWRVFAGRRIAPIWTLWPPIINGPARVVRRDDGVLCTSDVSQPGVDAGLPGRCGPDPTPCSLSGEGPLVELPPFPAHPGRAALFRRYDSASASYVDDPTHPEARTVIQQGVELFVHQTIEELLYTQIWPIHQAIPPGELDALTNWPDVSALKALCTGQAHRLAHGGGFHHINAYCCGPGAGVPEPNWTMYFVPGPLNDWCHGHEANRARCVLSFDPATDCPATPNADQPCEPAWATLDDVAAELVCSDAIDRYALGRWSAIRQSFMIATGSNPPMTHQWRTTAWCDYLQARFSEKFAASPPFDMCSP